MIPIRAVAAQRRADSGSLEAVDTPAIAPAAVRQPANYRLSVVVPCFNERDKLPSLLAELVRRMPTAEQSEIVIVDDGSTDGTREWLLSFSRGNLSDPFAIQLGEDNSLWRAGSAPGQISARVHFQPENRGKGAALRAGFALSRFEVLVVQDADLEYDPGDLGAMFALIARGAADVVYGSRFCGKTHRSPYLHHDQTVRSLYLHHYLANWLISRWVDVLCNSRLTDVEVCYKMFRREVIEAMTLSCDDFGFEVEFTVKMLRAKRWRVYESNIAYYPRTFAEGKKINWKDGVRALWYALRFRFF